MSIHVHYSESEALNHLGWVAKMCVRCNCIRAFTINEIVEKTSLSLSFIPISNSTRRTNSCIAQCDFCGFSVRHKPKHIDTSWGPSLDFDSLVRSTMPEATPEQAPNRDVDGVIAVLSQHIQILKPQLTGFRSGLPMMGVIYIITVFISIYCLITPPRPFTYSPQDLQMVEIAIIICPAFIAYALFLLISRFRYRYRCDQAIAERLRHLADRYDIPESSLQRIRHGLAAIR